MNVAGIVCEYNPFHNGHLWHIARTRALCADSEPDKTAVVCVMSGNIQQRGDFALMDKFARAEAAVRGGGEIRGADLVFELPAAFSCSSAERFAYAAVSLLSCTGVVTHLSFGSESGDLDRLIRARDCLYNDRFPELLHEALDRGLSFPAAREVAARVLLGDGADVFSAPNDILGIEYLKAIKRLDTEIRPVAVSRRSAGHHHDTASDGFASAGHIRRLVLSGRAENARGLMPEPSYRMLLNALETGRAPVDTDKLNLAMLAQLRRMAPGDFAALPDSGEGLSDRLYRVCRACPDIETILSRAATRRYPRARIRRMLMCAFLGITSDMPVSPVPYLRVLAFNDTGRALLKRIKTCGSLPVIVKPAHIKTLDGRALRFFGLEALADDLLPLFLPGEQDREAGGEWRRSPVYIKDSELL